MRITRFLCLVSLLLAMMELPARAYTNPGTGLLIWQLGAAFLLGIIYQIRKLFFRGRK